MSPRIQATLDHPSLCALRTSELHDTVDNTFVVFVRDRLPGQCTILFGYEERTHDLGEITAAAAEHVATTGLSPMWAVTLLAGINDSEDDAEALAALVVAFSAKTGVSPRLSIIPYNATDEGTFDPFRRTPVATENTFREVLQRHGVFTHKPYSGGADVSAACGQLAARG